MEKQVGKTKDVGFQFGIRKTIPVSTEEAWDFLFSDTGIKIWLGQLNNDFEIKKEYETENGISGLVRVFKPNSHIRLTWKPKHWENDSTVQIRVIGYQKKATIAFHQEKLVNAKQRTEMKAYWSRIIEQIESQIKNVK